jgi:hypothetical protein
MNSACFTIVCGDYSKRFDPKDSLQIELSANILFQTTGNNLWVTIGNAAFKVWTSNVPQTVHVPGHIYDEFPLRHYSEYKTR